LGSLKENNMDQDIVKKSGPKLYERWIVQCNIMDKFLSMENVARKQALRGALAAGREKEGELATMSLEVEYLDKKKSMQNADCWRMFVYICARFCFVLVGGNLTAQSTGSHTGIGSGIRIPDM